MTKMLLGQNCASEEELNDDQVRTAINHVRNTFRFVGLAEHWNASICLFHRKFGAAMDITELVNLRPGVGLGPKQRVELHQQLANHSGRQLLELDSEADFNATTPGSLRSSGGNEADALALSVLKPFELGQSKHLVRVDKEVGFQQVNRSHDPFDFEVYEAVAQRFLKELVSFGLETVAIEP
jgi:hypothetical protein